MLKTEKERIVAELADRLAATETLIVADYRGLTNKELEALRARLTQHGARFSVVKNTLTRRAAESAGADSLLALLEGPTAIAFVEADGDPAAVAKALADTARDTKVLAIRGGVLAGSPVSGAQIDELSKLPPLDVLRSQVIGVVVAPLTQLVGLLDSAATRPRRADRRPHRATGRRGRCGRGAERRTAGGGRTRRRGNTRGGSDDR